MSKSFIVPSFAVDQTRRIPTIRQQNMKQSVLELVCIRIRRVTMISYTIPGKPGAAQTIATPMSRRHGAPIAAESSRTHFCLSALIILERCPAFFLGFRPALFCRLRDPFPCSRSQPADAFLLPWSAWRARPSSNPRESPDSIVQPIPLLRESSHNLVNIFHSRTL